MRSVSGNLQNSCIVIVAYNAESTIEWVLDRIDPTVARSVGAVLVSDDASTDRTAAAAERWAARNPDVRAVVAHHRTNRGYGGNQKYCYRWAMAAGYRSIVMIHGDGQYAPELADAMLEPLRMAGAHAVFGSRFLTKGAARKGGMPLYKFLGNRILTGFQNRMAGMRLSEWHTGYRAYSSDFLSRVDFDALSDDFDFDTEIILQLRNHGASIVEIPIPTFYGDEVCHVNGMRYAADVVADVWRQRHRIDEAALLEPAA